MTREKINYQNFLPQDLDQKLSALQPLLDQENEVLRRYNQLLVKKDNIKMGILCKVAGSLMPAGIANGHKHIWQLVQNNGNSLLSKCTFNQLCKTSNRKIMHLCTWPTKLLKEKLNQNREVSKYILCPMRWLQIRNAFQNICFDMRIIKFKLHFQ